MAYKLTVVVKKEKPHVCQNINLVFFAPPKNVRYLGGLNAEIK